MWGTVPLCGVTRLEKGYFSHGSQPSLETNWIPLTCVEWPCQGCPGAWVMYGPESGGSPLSRD